MHMSEPTETMPHMSETLPVSERPMDGTVEETLNSLSEGIKALHGEELSEEEMAKLIELNKTLDSIIHGSEIVH